MAPLRTNEASTENIPSTTAHECTFNNNKYCFNNNSTIKNRNRSFHNHRGDPHNHTHILIKYNYTFNSNKCHYNNSTVNKSRSFHNHRGDPYNHTHILIKYNYTFNSNKCHYNNSTVNKNRSFHHHRGDPYIHTHILIKYNYTFNSNKCCFNNSTINRNRSFHNHRSDPHNHTHIYNLPITTENGTLTETPSSKITTETYTTTAVTTTTTHLSSPTITVPLPATNAAPTMSPTTETSTITAVNPTITISSVTESTTTNLVPTSFSTTEGYATTAVSPTTTFTFSETTTTKAAQTTPLSTTNEASTTTAVNPTNIPVFSIPQATENVVPTTTLPSLPHEVSTTTAVSPATTLISSESNTAPVTTSASPAATATSSTTEASSTTSVHPTTTPVYSVPTTTENAAPTTPLSSTTESTTTTPVTLKTTPSPPKTTTTKATPETTTTEMHAFSVPTAAENTAPTETPLSTIKSEAYKTIGVTPTTTIIFSPIATSTSQSSTTKASTITAANPTKISETSYAVVFTINVVNISMPVDQLLRNNTYQEVQEIINTMLNTLLNEPGSPAFQSKFSNFTSATNQIDGMMGYNFNGGDALQPVSFLNELLVSTTTTVLPGTTTSFFVTSPNLISGSAVVIARLVFNSSSPVPSEDLVLRAINTLQISETSYAVVFQIKVVNISMPVDQVLRNNTCQEVQKIIDNSLNTLLNEPGSPAFQSKFSNFTSAANQIDGMMGYNFNGGDALQPVSFLNELLVSTTTTVLPGTTTSFFVTSPNLISGSAVVIARLVFNSSSPVPSEDLVLRAINTLRNSRESKLNESVKVVNVTYEMGNISMPVDQVLRNNTCQEVQKIIDNSLNTLLNEPGSPAFQSKFSNFTSATNQIDGKMGYNFNGGDALQPVSFLNELLVSTTTTVLPETTTSFFVTSPNLISGSAVVIARLVFNSSSPVPSEDLVLRAINTLLGNISMPVDQVLRNNTCQEVQKIIDNSLNTLLNEPGSPAFQSKFSNFTSATNQIDGMMGYNFNGGDALQPVSFLNELLVSTTTTVLPGTITSFFVTSPNLISGSAVVIARLVFNSSSPVPSEDLVLRAINTLLGNISMPVDQVLRNNTCQEVQKIIDNSLNTLLNEPGSPAFQSKFSNFTSATNQIDGMMGYNFNGGDALQPVSFLNELLVSTTTTVLPGTTTSFFVTSPNLISGSAVVIARLVFNSSSPVPSEDLVFRAINTLLGNISMPVDQVLRNNTCQEVQKIIDNSLNTLLNEPGSPAFQSKFSNFTSAANQIDGMMVYNFNGGDALQPVSFLNELLVSTTTTVLPGTTTSFFVTSPNLISGSAVVIARLVFNSSSPVPSEDLVFRAINTLRNSRESKLNESLNTLLNEPGSPAFQSKFSNFTSATNQIDGKMGYNFNGGDACNQSGSAVVIARLVFNSSSPVPSEDLVLRAINTLLGNISMPVDQVLRNNTCQEVQKIIDNLLNTLLNEPGSPAFQSKFSNFTSATNQIDGKMGYNFNGGDALQPVSFLNELLVSTTTTVLPGTTTSFFVTSPNLISGSAVVIARLVFNSSSPVPSEDLVLRAINTLLGNISMPVDQVLRNNTCQEVQKIIDNSLNTLLNEPGSPAFQSKFSNFTSATNQIDGKMGYNFNGGDALQPVSFLNELLVSTTTTVLPGTTTSFFVTSPNLISGSAVVIARLVFNSSSPVPSEDLVFRAINTLLVNISMPVDQVLRNNTCQEVQKIIDNLLNTLLNEPGSPAFQSKFSNFTSATNQIDGKMGYNFNGGDALQPVSFLNELLVSTTTTVLPGTTTSFFVTSPNLISGSAVVIARLVFNSSSPVPSEDLVLRAINTLRNSRESKLNESVKVVNVTYEKISETSYAVVFEIKVGNISMPVDQVLRNNTCQEVQKIIDNSLNTLLNEPGSPAFQSKFSNFTSATNQIDGKMGYNFNGGDALQPVSFLNELLVSTTTTVLPGTTTSFFVTSPNLISGSAVVIARLVFNSSSPVPSEDLVLRAINTLRNSRESKLNKSVKVVNVTYEKISETSYAVVFEIKVGNISMPVDQVLRNNTCQEVQKIIDNSLNTLLNEPGSPAFQSKFSNFTSATNQIDGKMGYNFNGGDALQPVSFLNELLVSTTTTVLPGTTTSFFVTSPNLISGSAVVIARLVFNSSSPVPSEDLVFRAINTLRNSRESKLNESVKVVNVTYEKISETSYAVVFEIKVVNISMPVDQVLRNNTCQEVQKIIDNSLNTLLNEPGSPAFQSKFSNFTSATNQIDGKMGYNFNGGDALQPVSFLNELLVSTTTTVLPGTTTSFFVTSPNLISGSAVVIARLVFNSSSPVPSEDLVLRAINTLRNSRESKLNESVKVVNVTYEKISETSYAVVFEIKVGNISMPVDQVLRNNTCQEVQKIIDNSLNTLLNEPGSPAFQSKFSNFTSATNQIDGKMGYNFNGGDALQPVSFLNELLVSTTTTVLPETTTSFFVTSPNLISGSAVVIARLVFNSSSPVPSEDLVLRAINTLRNSRESKLNESVKVVNVTYEKISETSYAVVFQIKVVNISMPVDQVLRNNTCQEVQKIIDNSLNTLLNEPGSPAFQSKFSNFTSATNQIDGKMGYNFNGGDALQPVSFLNELLVSTTTTVLPGTTTSFFVTSPNLISGSAVVIARLVFNSSSPVPSEDLVLRAINTLRNSRESKLNESVKVVNVTYEKISETSYAVVFEIKVVNISMPVDQVLRNNTCQEVQKIIDNSLNTLLNEPGSPAFQSKFSNFTSATNQIDGKMGYNFNGGDALQPVSFLNELLVSTTTTVLPGTTTSFFVTSPNLISGSAVVIARLVFNSSSPVPSEDLVLRAINTLRNSRESKLNESVKVVNVTYEKISETSYAVVFEIKVGNISMPVDQVLRNNTCQEVQKIIDNSLNTLLNEPGSPAFQSKFSNFTSATNQIDGMMGYNFNGGDALQPVSFLNELLVSTTTTVLPGTITSFFVTSPNLISGSAVVIARLVFNSSSPVPSEDLVFRAINTLRNSRESKLNESVKVVNVTYEKISETSYAVVFEIKVVNISMPVDQVLRNNTCQEVQKIIDNSLNTLLNEPGSPAFQSKFSNFTSAANQIDGMMGYNFNGGDALQPVSFLNELLVSTTTTVLPETTTSFFVTSPNLISGSAVVIARLVFNSSSPVPSEDLVLRAINTLRNSRESKLNESVKVVNVTYEKISETSYAVVFEIKVVNISMPVDQVLRNNTCQEVQKIIDNSLNTLLNEPGSPAFQSKFSNFTSATNQIDGKMGYNFNGGDALQPVSFLNELLVSTTTTVLPGTTTSFFVTSPNLISGSAVVIARLVFNSSSPVPSEDLVLRAINTLRNSRESKLNESVKVVNVTYEKISETSYAVVFEIKVGNISMPVDQVLRNNTCQEVQKIIDNSLNTLLNEPGSPAFQSKFSNFTSATNQIDGKMGYNFNGGDALQPVSFLNELLVSTTTTVLPGTTTSFFVTSPNLISGSAVVIARLVFNSSSPVPSEDLVFRAINTLRNSRESKLNESVKVVNVTYEKISETSYAVVFEIKVVNISMPVDQVLRNNTCQEVQKIIDNSLNTLLNEPGSPAFQSKFSNFTSATNQIDGKMGYNFNGGDALQPVSFLNELLVSTTTTVLPGTTTSFFVTSPNLISGSAVVIARLVFNSSSPVPSEDLVLRAINTLRNSRESKLNESVKVVNVTYEKISETSYAVVFEIKVVNISMPVDQVLRNNTCQEVQKIIDNSLNTLLNEPGSPAFQSKFSNFTSATNQIDGKMGYNFNGGDALQPVSFLNELLVSTTTTVLPETTTSFFVTSPNLISGSAVVTARLVFNSSSPVPSEDLVLRAINTLRKSRESKLNESVKVVNVTYEKISETSYAVVFEIKVVNISMPVDQVLRNNTCQEVQKIIDNSLNTLLNEPGSPAFQSKFSNFTSATNQIDGKMGYNFNGGDALQPVSFLNELLVSTTTTVLPGTTTSFFVTSPNLISGSAVVTARLVFNSSSPVPSEDLVLRAINTLRNSRESKLNESVKVVNVTYEKISETSYAVVFEIKVVNIIMPVDQVLRNNTCQEVQKIIDNSLNTLLNEPGSPAFQSKFSNFTSATNQIDGMMGYNFNGGDALQPVSFLNELLVSTTTTVLPGTTTSFFVTSPNLISGSAVVIARLVFNSSSPVPSEDLVLRAINTLRNSRESKLNESVKVVNVTYEKISETSYAVVFEIKVGNISMPVDQVLRNNTCQEVQKIIDNSLNTLLNEPGSPAFQSKFSNFTSAANQIDGMMVYNFNGGDALQPVSFLNELLVSTTTTVLPGTTTSFFVTSPNLISGSAVVIARLVFNSSSPVPSEDLVLRAINTLRNSRESKLNESVKVVNVTYEKISETSYAVVFQIKVVNISMPVDQVLRNNTCQEVQKIIDNSLNTLLNEPGSPAFQSKFSNFTSATNQIDGMMGYNFNGGDALQPVSFLNELLVSTTTTVLPGTTTIFFVTSPNLISGSAIVIARLVFNSSSPVPSEDLVFRAINTLRNSRESKLNESVKVVNVTYEKISETSYAVVFQIKVVNISMPVDQVLRNNTCQEVQKIIDNSLNTLLNEPGSPAFQSKFSNFTSAANQIDGMMGYNFNGGDALQPVSFLNKLLVSTTTTVLPGTTTSFFVTSPNLMSGSAVVIARLVFNSSSPVPSEDLVLRAINTLRNSRESKLNESVKVVNVTYEKISETSYAVVFEIKVGNISMPVDQVLRNNTCQEVQKIIDNSLNTLLNEPGSPAFQSKFSNFTSATNQIDGKMGYNFNGGDALQPVSFLNELLVSTTTTVLPGTTTSFFVTSPNLISGSAVVIARLVFNSSSPVPSEDLVFRAINTLRNSRESKLNESVKVVNVTYEKISETSYAVVFEIKVVNISMPVDQVLRNNTCQEVQKIIDNSLNTLLNEPGSPAFQSKFSNFTSATNQIDGKMGYNFNGGDALQPVSFQNELLVSTTTTVLPGTTTSFFVTSPNLISGSAVVIARLVFNSSSPVPSEDLVLRAINTLRNSRESKLNESVKVVNVTYEKISETSYAVVFEIKVGNISMPVDQVLRNNTCQEVQKIIDNSLNTLLNEPGSPAFQSKFSNFTSATNQIDGKMGYNFNGGDALQPVSFLNELLVSTTTTVLPGTTTSFFVTSPNLISGSAVVIARLVFNSSSPVPSEDLVLRAINTLRNSRESKLNESVKVVNVTYEKISETSYAVVFEIKVGNISMPVDQVLRNNTCQEVQKIIDNSLNTLLNEPGSPAFQSKFSNFTSATNQIDGKMGYNFNGGDALQPVSFLNELLVSTTTTVLPGTTTSFFLTSPNLISGSAVVIARLVFNSSSPVPSEDLVLRAINTLRISRESKLNESVKVVNVTYEKISETSYAVVFEIKVVNISMPVDQVLRNNTYQEVQKIIDNSLNTLLNEPGSPAFQSKFSNFTSATNQIDGKMGYNFNDEDAMQPVSFLNELRVSTTTTVLPETTTSFFVTSPNLISGSAVVTARLVFNSSSPVPSEDLVLRAINTLRNSRESDLNESVKVVTSYAVVFEIKMVNISMPVDQVLRNNTYQEVQKIINNSLNTLLNEPGSPAFQSKFSNFTSTINQIDGKMGYNFNGGDAIQPVSFLNKLIPPTVLTTASTLTTTPLIVRGKALIFIRLVFVTLAPLPNPDKVIEVANTLLKTRLATKQDTTTQDLSDSVSLVNVTYTKINETAYALNFGFEISNITMSEKVELRNGTHLLIQDSINSLLGKILLSNSSAPFIKFQEADFTGNSTVIQAKVEYVFSPNDFMQPSIFVQELQLAEVNALTTSTTSPPILIRKAIIKIRLDFITLGPRPSKDNVLEVVKTVLATNLTTKLTVKTVSVSDPVTLENVDYLAINDTAYALTFAFEINKVSLTESSRNEAYKVIQNKTNNLVTQILKDPSVSLLIVPDINDDLTVIEASVTYVFSQYNSNSAAGLLVGTLFKVFTTPVPTVTTTMSNNGTNAAWVVAIIVPCAIIIGLVPCWILLCCLLCGCCAAIRRRWHRRRSYNVQYTTRNSLF
ncbi:uncharacterized threonine-rich GPI-anchored glycoprotein PJ4664.02-like [Puntigrus tetrazona]|uniref:uncharacterized threonine-rich GPI-anchored glycoprotein PJ4664.02-like n=1 Tax=Puntigrus tetrazona TaxID=1606681 RepID=UPI001C8972CB|nr:uncharacterized threonine-rich GPI-anchored glycoprotein PJ4664.02-like [Puntigrus tetrazona]